MPPRLKRTVLASPVVLCGALYLGWWGLWPIHWTSQGRGEFPAAVGRYHAAVAEVTEAAPAGSFLHTGHRGGNYQAYAKNLQRGLPERPLSLAVLMDEAFEELGLTAIEIDVRPSPLEGGEALVVHDIVDGAALNTVGRDYVLQNTVRKTVEYFLAREHHLLGRRLVFEIKAPREGLDASAEQAVDRTARTLNEVLTGRADEAAARGALDLISFNHLALVRLHAALGASAAGHGLYQIVTSNQYPEWLYAISTQPPLNAQRLAELRETPWLRGVYFDPKFIDGFARLFNGINQARKAAGLGLLEIHVSTYSHDLDGLMARLQADTEPLRHVRGLMYQIRKD
jgi:hypothetical protein